MLSERNDQTSDQARRSRLKTLITYSLREERGIILPCTYTDFLNLTGPNFGSNGSFSFNNK